LDFTHIFAYILGNNFVAVFCEDSSRNPEKRGLHAFCPMRMRRIKKMKGRRLNFKEEI
jgi:hypothetical protein